MKSLRIPLPVVAAFMAGAFVASPRAQDALQGPYGATGASTTVYQTPASSVRAAGPFDDNHPGTEGQFGTDPTDPNHLYVYHLSHWRSLVLSTSVTP